jgi:hypothetical protein
MFTEKPEIEGPASPPPGRHGRRPTPLAAVARKSSLPFPCRRRRGLPEAGSAPRMATAGCFARIWWELAQLIGGGARATRYLWVAVAVLGLAGRQLRPRRPGVAGRRREDVVACLRASLEDLLRSPLSCAVGGGLGDAELCFCEAVAVDVCVSGQICAGVGARRHGRLGVAGALAAARKTTRWCDCGGALAVRSQLLLPARASVWSGMGRWPCGCCGRDGSGSARALAWPWLASGVGTHACGWPAVAAAWLACACLGRGR